MRLSSSSSTGPGRAYPRRGSANWGVGLVPTGEGQFQDRMKLPEAWAGLRDEELAKVTGVPDAVFCHRALFLAVAKSKEGALALAKLALGSNTN